MGLDWGGTTKEGYLQVSNAFLDYAHRLNISDGEFVLVQQILRHSWNGKMPFPKVATLAKLIGKSEETVRLRLRALRGKGLLRTVRRQNRSSLYDFTPLFQRLRELVDPKELTGQSVPDPKESRGPIEEERTKKTQNLASPPDEPEAREKSEPEPVASEPSSPSGLGEVVGKAMRKARLAERGRKAVENRSGHKRMRAFRAKAPSEYNCNDMELVLRDAWEGKGWSSPSPKFTGRDRKHAKELIDHYGAEQTAEVLRNVVDNWSEYVRDFGLNGYPSMPLVYGYRNSFFPRVLDGKEAEAKPKWGSHFDDSDSRPKGTKVGW